MRSALSHVCIVVAVSCAVACGGAVEPDQHGEQSQDIIGGFAADSSVLDHTGSILIQDFAGLEPFCSASLVGPDAIITAKHCAEITLWGFNTYFGVGPDAYAPKEAIRIAAVDMAPLNTGGFVGYGQDVAILHLDHAPAAVTPIAPAASSDLVEGTRMVTLGYGVFGAGGAFDGHRRIGRETVIATDGLSLAALFGNFESFVEWYMTYNVSDENYLEILAGDPILDELLLIYESEVLLPGDEAATGNAKYDTQSCNGDSGGPLLRYVPGSGWHTYGVVSGGFFSTRSSCDFGTVFATFGEEVMTFVDEALTWQDPCGAVTVAGACTDNVAQNCVTDVSLGIRALEEQDCDATDQSCVLLEGGAACGALPSQPPATEGVGTAARSNVSRSFFYDGRAAR